MSISKKIIATILGIFLATISLYAIEQMGYANDFRNYFFGGITDMGQFKTLIKADWIKGTRNVMFLLFAFTILYIIVFALVFEIFAVVYFVFSSKWRKPKVFISYKNSDKEDEVNTTKIALNIKTFLEEKGFQVFFFHYTESMHHDQVNFEIQKMLRACNAMVVIPDPYHPSYVDSEILYASTEQKPVFIIKHTKDQKLPNTANSGHTVFLWPRLKKAKLEPLSYLLKYVHGFWKMRLFVIGTPLISFLMPFMVLDEESDGLGKAIFVFAIATVALVFFSTSLESLLWILKIGISAIGVYVAYYTLLQIFKTINFQNIIKQSILSSGHTYDHYVAAELDKSIIYCLDKQGLAIND